MWRKAGSLELIVTVAVLAVALTGLWIGLGYRMGTARSMGPGYYPVVISALLACLAFGQLVEILLRDAPLRGVDWRAMLAVPLAIGAFAVIVPRYGMFPGFAALIGLAALAQPRFGIVPVVVLSAGMCLFSWLVFKVGLGMTIPLYRSPF